MNAAPGLTPATQAAAAVAELQRRQRAGSSLAGPGSTMGPPSPIAAPKPPAGLLERPKVEPFARRVAAPELPPAVQAIADSYRPGRPATDAGPMDPAAAVAAMKRDRRDRFLERFGGRMTIATGGQVLAGDGPRLDDLEATIELAERPRWAPLVERDPEGLGAVEWWLRQVGRELGPQFRQGLAVDQVGQLAYREMLGEDLSLEDRATLATGLEGQPAETTPGAAANLLGSSLPTLGEGVRGAVAGAATGAAVGFLATGGPGAPAGAAAGAAAVGMAASAAYSYRTQAGLAWAEFGQFVDESGQGLDPDVRKAAAAAAGLLGAGLETVGLGAILRQFPGLRDLGAGGSRELVRRLLARPSFRQALGAAAKGWASAVTVETATEVAQELVNITAGELAKVADGDDFAAITGGELVERLGSTAWQTARGMALLAIPGPAASFAVDLRRAAKADRQTRAYLALGDLATKSKARAETPAEFQGWVADVREAVGGPVDSILVDGEAFKTFFQEQGVDPEAVAAELGVVEQYRSFADNGGQLSIPLEVWAAKVAATPAHKGLADHVRLTPDAMTPAEARQYRADLEEMAAEAADAAPASPAGRILEDVARQLEAAGRAPDVARQEAAIFAAFFGTMGERSGVDPWVLYQRQALEVRRVLPEGLRGLDDSELDAILGRTRPADDATGEAAAGQDARPLLVQGLEALEAGDLDRLASIVDAMGAAGEDVPGLFSRAAPAPSISRADSTAPAPATDRAYLPDGQAVDVAFEVVELAELIASNTADLEPNPAFPAALQPRDRTRAASGEQVARMAGGLVPELLGRSANVSDGAPIVGPDGVVESGNGRVLALDRAYRSGMDSARRYRAWLQGEGYAVEGMAAPVLIRRRLSEMNDTARQRFARAANVRTTASMSAAEQARADAAALTPDLLAIIRSNDIEAASNRPFASRFLGTIAGGSELGQLVDGEGRLSLDGRRRIRGALLARAYGDIALVEKLLEEDEGGLGPLGRALLDAAPEWARLDDAETTTALLEAVRAVVRQRDSKNPLHFALQQSDAFGGGLSVDGRAFLASFLNVDPKTGRSRLLSRVRLRKLLEAVVDEAAKHQGGASLLGDADRPSVGQIVAAVDKRARRELVETLAELGLDPATATAADIEAAKRGGLSAVAFDPGQVKSAHNAGTFDPADPRLLRQDGKAGDPRGAITFTPDGRTLLRLFSGANLSTVLHEAGHLFLEVYGQLDAKPGTPAHIRADYQRILDWLGVIDTADIGREHHEKFARGFEAYLMEGRAPSLELQRPFARFRAWLVLIYRTLRGLDVDLSDDVRRVFDRMLATDDAIKAAERAGHFAPLFPDNDRAGMTPGERRAYLEQAERATLEATRQLERDAMEALERERSDQWAKVVERHALEVAQELDARPGFRALAFFGGGLLNGEEAPPMLRGLKLSRSVIRDDYGADAVAALEAKRGQLGRILAADGVHPDDVADVLGFGSGAELVAAMAAAPDRAEVIKAEAERRARAELGDAFLSPSTLAEAATEAVHNDERALFLSTELKMLAGRVGAVAPPLQVIKAAAARAVEAETVRQVTSPDRHLYTSQKWARDAQRHVARGDFRAATEAKRRQLFHFEAWKLARRDAKSIENTLKRWDMISRGRVKNLPAVHRDQILGFLERVDFRKASRAEVERRRERSGSLEAWIKAQEDQGLQVEIDERLRSEAKRPHYSELSVAEFMAYRDTVRHIEHLGLIDGKLLAANKAADFSATVDSIVQSITDNAGTLEPVKPDFGPKKGDKRSWRRFLASHRKMEFIFAGLDGYKLGPVWEALFKPLADAQGAEADLHLRLSEGLRATLGRYSRAERRAMRKRSIHVAELGQTFTRASLLSLALNWGNDGNRRAVLEGYGWNASAVQAALDAHLDARDWQVVQELWRLVDSLWPDIEALQKDLTGSAPPKVDPIKVQTPFGEIDGGYYPLMYDPDLSHKAFVREEQQATAELFGGSFTRPATRKGHTIARVGSGGQPVLLDLGVLPRHLAQVAKDITHRRAVIDVARLTEAPAVRDAITAALGRDTYQLIRPWLQSIAAPAYDPGSGLEAVFARARVGVTVANMGLKLTTAIVQPLGWLTTIAHLGPRWSLVGVAEVFKAGPFSVLEARDFAFSRSAEMRHRQKAFDRDVKDTIRRLTGEAGLEQWRAAFFWHIGALDMLVALPTWHGAYRQALDADPGNEAAAIAAADSAVRMTQSAGGVKDLARIQAGTELQRLFTAFYSYFSVLFNQFEKSVRQTNFANPADYPRFIGQQAALWFVPAVLGELIVGRGPDDDEAWQAWAAKALAAYPLQSVVFVRDLANGVLGGFGYDLAPAGDVFGSAVRLGVDIAQGDFGRSAITNATMAAAFWWGLPGRQMIITGEAFTDWLTGDFDPESFGEALRYGLLQRRPPDER